MKKILIAIALLIPAVSYAQDAINAMTLKECLTIGLERNYDIRITRNQQRIATNNVSLGNAGFLPKADLSAGYSGTLNNTKQFPESGGDAITSNGVHNSSLNAGVNLNWTVFDGFSVQTSYDRLKQLRDMGELGTRLQVEEFISGFMAEYYNYIRQNIRLKNLQYAVQLSQERVRIVEAGAEVGSMAKFDLQQAKVDLNSDQSQLIKQYEVIHTLRTRLNEMLAMEDMDYPLTIADSVIEYNPSLERQQIWETAVANNIYLKIARKEGDISRLDLKAVQSRNYPYLRLNAGYGYTGNWYGASTWDRQRTLGANYGITMGFTIFDGFNQRRLQRNAKIDIENRELEYGQTEQALKADLANAWMAYRNNIDLLELESKNLETARSNYDIAAYRYKLYQLSGIEFREAQNSLLSAEERYVQVLYDTKMCEISLVQISGRITSWL